MDDSGTIEALREALVCLHDPPKLVMTHLATRLVECGVIRSGNGLHSLLLDAINRMKPYALAPAQSRGWRHYRYLQLRYVECCSHEAIAQDLTVSVRQAARIHQEALGELAQLILPGVDLQPTRAAPSTPKVPVSPKVEPRSPRREIGSGSLLENELSTVGRMPPDSDVDVVEVIRGVHDILARGTSDRVRFELQPSSKLSPVRVNRIALRQILINLLLFLQRALPPSAEAAGAIMLRAEQAGDLVEVTAWLVPGSGGAPRAVAAAEDELLLTAARHLAKMQGAELEWVDAEQAQLGLRLSLPAQRGRTVLVVDDNSDVGELFRRLLSKTPYWPMHVRFGTRALRVASESLPDAIILDVVMPTLDGWEILTALQADSRTARIPVIVCSVLPDRELALSLGAASFLAKPVTRSSLLETLDRLPFSVV